MCMLQNSGHDWKHFNNRQAVVTYETQGKYSQIYLVWQGNEIMYVALRRIRVLLKMVSNYRCLARLQNVVWKSLMTTAVNLRLHNQMLFNRHS